MKLYTNLYENIIKLQMPRSNQVNQVIDIVLVLLSDKWQFDKSVRATDKGNLYYTRPP